MKPWWASRAVWGGVVSAASGIAGLFGITLGEAEQAQITDALLAISSALATLGGALAIFGRLRATTAIGKQQ